MAHFILLNGELQRTPIGIHLLRITGGGFDQKWALIPPLKHPYLKCEFDLVVRAPALLQLAAAAIPLSVGSNPIEII